MLLFSHHSRGVPHTNPNARTRIQQVTSLGQITVKLTATSPQRTFQRLILSTRAALRERVAVGAITAVEDVVMEVAAGGVEVVATVIMALAPRTTTGRLPTTTLTTRMVIQKVGKLSLAMILGRTVGEHTRAFGVHLVVCPRNGRLASANLLGRSNQPPPHTRHKLYNLLYRVGSAHLENIPHQIILVNLHPPRWFDHPTGIIARHGKR